jgi:hypothetical protein
MGDTFLHLALSPEATNTLVALLIESGPAISYVPIKLRDGIGYTKLTPENVVEWLTTLVAKDG